MSRRPAKSGESAPALGLAQGVSYGFMGLPLAFVALPLYIVLPHHYAQVFGLPLATLGLVLLAARLFDAGIDPMLGRVSDHLYARSLAAVLGFAALAAMLLVLGFALLFFPPTREPVALVAWALVMLCVTYIAYSALSICHQSWGAMLGGDDAQRGKIVAWREGFGLVGVVLASVVTSALGLTWGIALLFIALLIGIFLWARAPRPVPRLALRSSNIWLPFSRPSFNRLLAVFLINGVASAVPATLILFFIQDRLQTPAAVEPAFLAAYFVSAALALPCWLVGVRRMGLEATWLAGMALALAVFAFASQLGAGDGAAFFVVCVLSGVALGPDLAVPGALLAGLIAQSGDRGHAEGAYFGWWNFATKLNLALAAGLALPVLGLLGYAPGARDAAALNALTWAYCMVPCVLKLIAATLLYTLLIRKPQ